MAKKRLRKSKLTLRERIKAYKLDTQVRILFLLIGVCVISGVVLFVFPIVSANDVSRELLLALFTSVLVSVFTIAVEITVDYNNRKSEEYLEDLKIFGIGGLCSSKTITKKDLIIQYLDDCDRCIWISGYRLILTWGIHKEICEVIKKKKIDVRVLVCPPWTEAFQTVYQDEFVMDNYFKFFYSVYVAAREAGSLEKATVVFVNKPLFNDTYRIDQKLVTGPYMHNRDDEYHRMMANDFFAYDLIKQSELYNKMSEEFITLFGEAKEELDWKLFAEKYENEYDGKDLKDEEKIELFRSALKESKYNEKNVDKLFYK